MSIPKERPSDRDEDIKDALDMLRHLTKRAVSDAKILTGFTAPLGSKKRYSTGVPKDSIVIEEP